MLFNEEGNNGMASFDGGAPVILRKNEKVSLKKHGKNFDEIKIGLGWHAAERGGATYDLDASAFMLTENGKVHGADDFIFYGHTDNDSKSIHHMGDDLVGGDGNDDDEVIMAHLKKIPSYIDKVLIVVSIYDARAKRQTFGEVDSAYIHIIDAKTNDEISRFDLTEDYSTSTAIEVAALVRDGNSWYFEAVGSGKMEELGDICRRYGLAVAD